MPEHGKPQSSSRPLEPINWNGAKCQPGELDGRRGAIRVAAHIYRFRPAIASELFRFVIPLQIDMPTFEDSFIVYALSPLFDRCEPGELTPQYDALFRDGRLERIERVAGTDLGRTGRLRYWGGDAEGRTPGYRSGLDFSPSREG